MCSYILLPTEIKLKQPLIWGNLYLDPYLTDMALTLSKQDKLAFGLEIEQPYMKTLVPEAGISGSDN